MYCDVQVRGVAVLLCAVLCALLCVCVCVRYYECVVSCDGCVVIALSRVCVRLVRACGAILVLLSCRACLM